MYAADDYDGRFRDAMAGNIDIAYVRRRQRENALRVLQGAALSQANGGGDTNALRAFVDTRPTYGPQESLRSLEQQIPALAEPSAPQEQPQDDQQPQGNALRAMFGPQESLRSLESQIPALNPADNPRESLRALEYRIPSLQQSATGGQSPTAFDDSVPLMARVKAIRKQNPALSEQQAYALVADQYSAPRDRADMIPVNSIRNNETGEITYLGQNGGPSESPYGPGSQPRFIAGASQQAPMGGPMRVVGAGNGTTVELSPEVAPAKVDLDYSRPPVDVPGVGKVYYDKSGRGAYAVDGNGRPTAKVLLGYDMQASMDLTKKNTDLAKTNAEIAHTNAATAEIGAPKYQLTPEGDVFDPKSGQISAVGAQGGVLNRQKQKAAYDAGLKELQKDDTSLNQLTDLEQAYKRWAELQANVTTGRIAGHLPAIMNPERQEMLKLENYLAMNNFKPGQGSMSNFERSLIKGSGPNVLNDPEANMNIIKMNMGAIQNMKDRVQFRQAYLNAQGSLLGADQAWQRYLDENPRFVKDKTGQLAENDARQDWQSYFSNGGSQVRPEVAPKMTQSIPSAAIEFLKRNPASAMDFDRKYGQGAAQRALGR